MATDNKFKKQTAAQWIQAFPSLKALAQNKLYKIVGPFLLGLDIDPLSSGKYRPMFVLHTLYEGDLAFSLKYVRLYFEFFDERNLQFNIPFEDTNESYKRAVPFVEKKLARNFADPVNWNDFAAFIDDEYVNNIDFKTHAAFKAILLSLKFHVALYLDDKALMQAVLDEIEIKRKTWNMEHFNSLHKDYDTWYNNLREKMNKRAEFMAVIEKNCEDKKISKLTVVPIVR